LFDADKLDSLGAVGVGRIFLFGRLFYKNPIYTGRRKKAAKSGGKHSYSKEIRRFGIECKLKYVKDRIMTATGKKDCPRAARFMVLFFKIVGKN